MTEDNQNNQFNEHYKIAMELLEGNINLNGRRSRIGLFKRSKIKRAIDCLKMCVSINKESWQSMFNLGKAYQVLGDHENALEWFEGAIKFQDENSDLSREATLESLSSGNAEKATTHAEKALKLKPEDSGLYSNYALALLISKRGEEAVQAIEKAIELSPDDPVNKNVLEYINTFVEGGEEFPDRIDV